LLVHVILEGFAAIDEYYGNFIVELAAKFEVGVNINFAPGEPSAAGQFSKAFLHHFAQVASLPGIHHDTAQFRHRGEDFSA